METTATLLLELRDKLKLFQKQEVTYKAFAGFDGFIDRIQKVVRKKHSTKDEYFIALDEFADHLKALAGKSGQVELITVKTKMGGNAPIFSNALARLTVPTTCLGAMGFPEVHPVFEAMHPSCQKISVSQPGISNAFEFNDGKLIFSELDALTAFTWNEIVKNCSLDKIDLTVHGTQLFALLDWVNLPHATSIWQSFHEKVIKRIGRKDNYFIFDLCDPSKKSGQEIDEVIDLIGDFSLYGYVTLGLNENETNKIWMALTGRAETEIPSLEVAARFIYQAMNIDTLLIHPIDRTLVVTNSVSTKVVPGYSSKKAVQKPFVFEMKGNVVRKPKVLTGGGDNLNAGYCLGLLAGYEIHYCMLLGMAASGAYIQSGSSPGIDELIGYIEKWADTLNHSKISAYLDEPVRRIEPVTTIRKEPYHINPLVKFKDRADAAQLLANKLKGYKDKTDAVVIAILAGGVPIGYHLSSLLNLPFDIIPCKKICHPSKIGKTIGSVTLNEISIHDDTDIPGDYTHHQVRKIQNELIARYKLDMQDRKPISLKEKTVILVDDRLKTGDTMLACLKSIKIRKPSKIIVAVPVTTLAASHQIIGEVDDFICVVKTFDFQHTDDFYENLPRVNDREVKNFLDLV
jgi:predicted phosphoribosyltransferase